MLRPCPVEFDDKKTPWWAEPRRDELIGRVRLAFTIIHGANAKIADEFKTEDLRAIGGDAATVKTNAIGKIRNMAARRGYRRIIIHKIWMETAVLTADFADYAESRKAGKK